MFPPKSEQRLRDELVNVILGSPPEFMELTDATSLIRSGLVDSQRLVNIALIVERELGHQIDFSQVDLERDLDTITGILRFIQKHREFTEFEQVRVSHESGTRAMDSSFDITSYRPEFKQQVLELLTQLWSPSLDLNRAYFEWKHERNPYSNGPLLYLALHQGKVVGMRSFFGVQLEAGGRRQLLTGLYADDLVIDRGHRNRGLIPRIMRTAFKDLARLGYEYIFNLSAGPITLISAFSEGWRQVGVMHRMRFRSWRFPSNLAVHSIARKLLVRSSRTGMLSMTNWGARSLAEIDRSQVARLFEKAPSVSFDLAPRVDAMAALVDRIRSDDRIRCVRDHTYFSWRFQNPFRRYGFLFCGQAALEGYLVLEECTTRRDRTALNIVDWEATSVPVLNRLLEAARHVAGHDKQLNIWSSTLSGERLFLLAKNGFRKIKEQGHVSPLLVRALANEQPAENWLFAGRRLVDFGEWDLRMLDSMHW